MAKTVVTKGRISALKMTLLGTSTHRYPYDDRRELATLKAAGWLNDSGHITLAGALVVLQAVASIKVPWLAVSETQRVVAEIAAVFGDELKLPK